MKEKRKQMKSGIENRRARLEEKGQEVDEQDVVKCWELKVKTRTRRSGKDEKDKEDKEENQGTERGDDERAELHKTNKNTARSEKDRNWSFKSNLFRRLCVYFTSALLSDNWTRRLQPITSVSDEHIPLCSLLLYCAFHCLSLMVAAVKMQTLSRPQDTTTNQAPPTTLVLSLSKKAAAKQCVLFLSYSTLSFVFSCCYNVCVSALVEYFSLLECLKICGSIFFSVLQYETCILMHTHSR